MAAFVRPWQMTTAVTPGGAHTLVGDGTEFPGLDDTAGGERESGAGDQDAGSTSESLPHIEDMFGDRCGVLRSRASLGLLRRAIGCGLTLV